MVVTNVKCPLCNLGKSFYYMVKETPESEMMKCSHCGFSTHTDMEFVPNPPKNRAIDEALHTSRSRK